MLVVSITLLGDTATLAQVSPPSTWTHVGTYNEGFFSPGEFRILGDKREAPSRLLVLDHYASDQALARLRLEDGSPISRVVRSGQGPGEVSGEGMEISLFSDGGVFLWDGGQRRANVYSADLRFEGQVEGLQNLSVDPVALVNDSTLVGVTFASTSTLFKLYRLHRDSGSIRVAEEPLTTVDATDHGLLDQGQLDENFMLRQGVARRIEEELYFGFTFGSLVVGISENGLGWATDEPVNHALPVYDFRDGNTFAAPDVGKFAKGILDLTGNASHLYVLYSGQKIEDTGILERVAGNIAGKMEAIHHSNRLFVFDRTTGEFIKEVRLPIRAKSIEITSRYAVLFTTEDREAPTFEVYRIR